MKIRTILNDIDPEDLGVTLTHEHISMRFDFTYVEPEDKSKADLEWSLKNSSFIRQNPYSHKDNLVFNDAPTEKAVLESLDEFKVSGGGAMMEMSTYGLRRKNEFLLKAAKSSGVHIIAGTGYYVAPAQTDTSLAIKEEQMALKMTEDLMGNGKDGLKCGFIGEVGCSYPIHDFEKKSVRASASVQDQLGTAVSFHPGRYPDSPREIMRIFLEAGGKEESAVMGHLERTIQTKEGLAEFTDDFKCVLEYDLFGIENSYYQMGMEIDFPSDAQRMDMLSFLVNELKYEDKLVIAQDIHTKHRLETFGGHGFSHITKNVIPKMIRHKSISRDQVDKILKTNPARLLATF